MLPDRVSNPGPLTYESGALPIVLRGPAFLALLGRKRAWVVLSVAKYGMYMCTYGIKMINN